MNEPKFKIGDRLYWRQDLEAWRDSVLPLLKKTEAKGYVSMGEMDLHVRRPTRIQVIEILTQRCYGGMQIHYEFRRADFTTFKLTEAELTDEELDPRPSPAPEER